MSSFYVFTADVRSRQSDHHFEKKFFSYDADYVPRYGEWDVVVQSVEEFSSDTQYRHFGDAVVLFGRLFTVDDDHSGRYVFEKKAWLRESEKWGSSWKDLVSDFDPAEYDEEYEDDGYEYVSMNFGGMLHPVSDQYSDAEDALGMLPWYALAEEHSDVGNG